MTPESVLKTPAGLLSVTVDFTGVILPANTSLASYSVDLDPALEVVDAAMTSTRVTLEIKGGVLGAVYTVRVLGTANKPGLQAQESFTVRVVSALSEEVLAPNAPGVPRNAVVSVSGRTLTFTFDQPESLGSPAEVVYVVHIGGAVSDVTVTESPAVFQNVPYGSYATPRIRAYNASGFSPDLELPAIVVGDRAPVFASDPSIAGEAVVDADVVGVPGTFTDNVPGSSAWFIEDSEGSGNYISLQTTLAVRLLDAYRGRNLRFLTFRTYNGGSQSVSRWATILVPKITLAALMPPSIGNLALGSAVPITQGTYNIQPDAVTLRLMRTPVGGAAAQVALPYMLSSIDNGVVFEPIETATKAGQATVSNPGQAVTFTLQAQAKPLASVSAVANHAAGTITFTMVPAAGESPDGYRVGVVGRPLVFVTDAVVVLPFAPGTGLVPTASSVVGTSISTAVNGAAVNLFAPLTVTGALAFTTGSEATQGEVLAYSGLTISGSSSVAHRWTDDGVTISGQTGATLDTAGKLGTIGLEITIAGQDGTTATRTASLNVVAPPAIAPSAPQNLRIGTTAGDGVPIAADAPASAGSSAITGYELTYSLNGGAPVTLQSATRDFLITGLTDSRTIVATMAATNGTLSAASAPMTVHYIHGLATSINSLGLAGPSVATFVALSDHDRARGNVSLINNGSLAGSAATLRDQSGALITNVTLPIVFSPNTLTTQRSLVLEGVSGSMNTIITGYYVSVPTDMGQVSASSVTVGGTITVDRPASFPQFNPVLDEMRYRLRFLDSMQLNSPSVDQPFSSATTATNLAIPPEALGKYLLVIWNAVDKLTGYPFFGSSLFTEAGSGHIGPIVAAASAITITNTTAHPGEPVLLSSIPGYTPAKGIRITVTAMTDTGQTGGVVVSYRDSVAGAGEIQPVGLFGYSLAGSVYDIFPGPEDLNANGQGAFMFAPAGAGTYSYTITVQARP